MKLRNKKTGEIVEDGYVRETHDFQFDGQKHVLAVFKGNGHRPPERVSGAYKSLAELNEDWEDAPEEPKEYWYIDCYGIVVRSLYNGSDWDKCRKSIGNYFLTRGEAEKAVEKLKAFRRLEDKGFRFVGWQDSVSDKNPDMILFKLNEDAWETDTCDDLDICFGGEE